MYVNSYLLEGAHKYDFGRAYRINENLVYFNSEDVQSYNEGVILGELGLHLRRM